MRSLGSTRLGTAWSAPDTRRTLQLLLAGSWLLDGVLQLQPFMFSSQFGTRMLAPMAQGSPRLIAHSITWASQIVADHSIAFGTGFALLQIMIGIGIALRQTVKIALATSVVWALAVWWFGEGLGGLAAGLANPVSGAPGAVLPYALLAILLWPSDRRPAAQPFLAARAVGEWWARGLWGVLWGVLAFLALSGANRSPDGLAYSVRALEAGQPHWLASLDQSVANLLQGRGLTAAAATAALLLVVAAGVNLRTTWCRAVLVLAMITATVIWVFGENFGGLFSGSGTDPNSGPLLVVLALAYWPRPAATAEPPVAATGMQHALERS